MKRRFTVKSILIFALFALVILPGCIKDARLSDTFFNFDAHVWVKDTVNDFHLDMCCIEPEEITWNFFIPVGYLSVEARFRTEEICCGTRAIWEFTPSLEYCNWVHVGVGFRHNPCVRPIGAVWTRDGKPIARAPFPMQIWLVEEAELIDVIMNPKHCYPDCEREKWANVQDITGPIELDRSWAFSDQVFELEQLTWDNDKLMKGLDWQDEETITLKEGDKTELRIKDVMKHKAVLVRYTVRSLHPEAKGEVIYHFINEAVIAQE